MHINFNYDTIPNLRTLCWHDTMPAHSEIITMLDLMIQFIVDTESTKGIQMYKPLKGDDKPRDGFDFKRDVHAAMKDFYLDHPTEDIADLKWNIVFKNLVEPLIHITSRNFTHDEFTYKLPAIIREIQSLLSFDLHETTPTKEEFKQAYINLTNQTTEFRKLNEMSEAIGQMLK